MQQIFVTGLPGSGKSTIGRLVAEKLGWSFVDTDALLAEQSGCPIGQVLTDSGERKFRQLESEALLTGCRQERVVIATGGGAVTTEANRTAMRGQGLTVYLEVAVELAWQRIQAQIRQAGDTAQRPLLAGGGGQHRLQALYTLRRQWYEQAEVHLHADDNTPSALAGQIIAFALTRGYLSPVSATREVMTLNTATATSQAIVEWGGLRHLPNALQSYGFSKRIFIVTDSDVGQFYGKPVEDLLMGAGLEPHVYTIPAGEASKGFSCVQSIFDWLVEQRAERQEPLLALGGGVVGDLTGFIAACYHRGIPFIQVPTSLLAQVDAAIGGKTGINHPCGKNIIGAFHQPRFVLVDPAVLLTLPRRVYREGWAEIVKYGMALDSDLFELLEASPASVHGRNATVLSTIITRCVSLKMKVVGCDERDAGQRNILNYGHTFGHALESLAGYGAWLHGEAVSLGMEVAAHIAVAKGVLSQEDALRQRKLLHTLQLPVHCSGLDIEAVLSTMQRDKKVREGRMNWIVPTGIGHAEMRDDIPLALVRAAVEAVQILQ